jgi:hypothetical protein
VVPQSPDDDKLLSDLWRAAAFMQAVRVTQAESGKTMAGSSLLSLEQEEKIIEAARNSAVVGAVKEQAQVDGAVNQLAERFEEMCRRQQMKMKEELRPALHKLLATELLENHKAMDWLPVEKLIPVTTYQGAVVPEVKKEFGHFFSPWIIENAVKHYPGHPRGYLSKVGETAEMTAAEPEFKRFLDTPEIFITAAALNPLNPRPYLREKANTIDAILTEPEFKNLHPDDVTMTVMSASDPRARLREKNTGSWQSQVTAKREEGAIATRQV